MPEFIKVAAVFTYVLYLIVFMACLLEVLFPQWYWQTLESWKATKEPSKAYFLRMRVTGIIGMVIITAISLAPTLIAHFDK